MSDGRCRCQARVRGAALSPCPKPHEHVAQTLGPPDAWAPVEHVVGPIWLRILGGLCMPAFLLSNLQRNPPAGDLQLGLIVLLTFGACLVGELLERYLFFAAVAAPRMPGTL